MTVDCFAIALCAIKLHIGQFLPYKINYVKIKKKDLQKC